MMRPICLALVLALGAPFAARAQEATEIKCATVAPDGSTWMDVLEKANKDLYRKSRGRVKFKFYAGGIQGEEKAVLEKMRYDQLQAGGFTGSGLGEIVPETRILEVPLLYRNYEEYDHVLAQLSPEFNTKFEAAGYVVLGWAEGGFANFMSQEEISTVADLRKAKVWVRAGDPLFELSLKTMGNQPVPLALQDVLTSLQTGHVSTVYISPLAAIALQWYPHLRFRADVPIMNITAAMLLKKDTYEKLSEKDRAALKETVNENLGELVRRTRADNEESKKILEEKGVKTIPFPAAEQAELDRVAEEISQDLVGKLYDQALLDRVKGLLAEYRKNH